MKAVAALLLFAVGSTSAPACAAELTSEELFDTFTARCAEIAADPEGSLTASATGQITGFGTMTDDKAVFFYSDEIKLPSETFAELSFMRNQLPSGTATTCMFNVTALDPLQIPIVPELESVITSRADAILGGPATQHGGNTDLLAIDTRMLLWTAGDGPSGSLITLNQSDSHIVLTMEIVANAKN